MRNRVVLAGTVALVALAGLAIWALSAQKAAAPQNNTATPPSQTDTTQKASTDKTAAALTITYTNSGFDKSSYTVKTGQAVTLRNNSSGAMQFSSNDHPTHLKNPELNLASLSAGQSTTFTPVKVGSWGVHDHLNPSMTTELIVTE